MLVIRSLETVIDINSSEASPKLEVVSIQKRLHKENYGI